MIASRLLGLFLFCFTFGIVAASPTPRDTAVAVEKRQSTADIVSVLNTLKGSTDTILPQFTDLINAGNQTEETLTPLFSELTGAIDTATTSLSSLSARGLVVRQSDDDVANLVASLLTDITTALEGLVDDLSTIPALGGLLGGLDSSLNQLLRGLETLLAGVLNLVAQLLVDVAGLLRSLALGLTLAALGLPA